MPQAFATWVVATVGAAGAVGTALYAAAYIAATVAITAGLTELSKMLGPKPKKMPTNVGEYDGTVESRRIIYGQVKVGGMNVIPPIASGPEGQNLHQVLAIAGHEVNSIPTVYANQAAINDAAITAITGSANDGKVTSGEYTNKLWVRRHLGSASQTVDYILDNALSDWTTNHRGRGVAYVALQYEYAPKGVYSRGKPEISVIVQGKKTYDPRLDPTPGNDPTNASYITYNTNPALALVDYLMDADLGMGEDSTRIDWSTVVAAANICDEAVSNVPSGSSPQVTTQTRYTANIVLDATDRFEDNIEALCAAMMGHCYYSMGQWQIYAGTWPASSAFALDEDDIAGSVHVQTETPRKEKYNSVRGQYYDSLRNYEPSEFEPRTNATYVTEDGEEIWREVALRGCTNEYEAQRNAIIMVRRSRNTKIVTADFKLSAFKVRPYEVGTLTLGEIGWTNKSVRCIGWEFRPEGTVRLTLRAENEADWDDPSFSEYTIAGTYAEPASGTITPSAPNVLTAEARPDGIWLNWYRTPTWLNVFGLPPGAFSQIVRHTASTFPAGSPIDIYATTYNTEYLDTGVGGQTYYYWVRIVSSVGTTSSWYPNPSGSPSLGIGATGTLIGSPGQDGFSTAILTAYKRSASTPTDNPGGLVYTFSSASWGAGSPTDRNGWTQGIPASTSPNNPVWAVYAQAYAQGTTDDIVPGDWSAPVKVFQDGDVGPPGEPGSPGTPGADGSPGAPAEWYWIKLAYGPLMKNSVGTLTAQVYKTIGNVANPVLLGNVKLYVNGVEVTEANGYAAGSNGWYGVFDAGDILDTTVSPQQRVIVVRAQDRSGSPIIDYSSTTLVNVVDGEQGQSVAEVYIYKRWATQPNTPSGGSFAFGSPSGLTPPGSPVGWYASIPAPTSPNTPVWASAGVASIDGAQGVDYVINWSAPVKVFQDGDAGADGADAVLYYIKALNGAAIKNGTGTLTLEAHRLIGSTDSLVSAASSPGENAKLYVGNTLVTVANGYAAGSDGYTGVFDSGDINGSVVVTLKDTTTSPHTVYDTYTLVDVADGAPGSPGQDGVPGSDAVYGYIETTGPLAWVRASDQSTWTPSGTTVGLDWTFVQGGVEVARVSRLVTRSASGLLTVGSRTHPGGDLNTSRCTPTYSGENTQSFTLSMTYAYGSPEDRATVTERVTTALSGSDGASAFTLSDYGAGPVTLWPRAFAKSGGSAAWDTGVRTAEGFTSGAFVAFTVNQNNDALMVGLDQDPEADPGYTASPISGALDYAFYPSWDGTLRIYESGVNITSIGAYSAGDRLLITYDDADVKYYRNGSLVRTVSAGSGLTFYLDSSINYARTDGNPQVYDIAFGSHSAPGQAVDIVFKYNPTQPSTPSPSASAPPSGWASDVGSATQTSPESILWSSVGTRATPSSNWVWQTPIQVEGADAPTLTIDATAQSFRYAANGLPITGQTITITANKQNISNAIVWSVSPTSSPTTSLGTGSPNDAVRTLTIENFDATGLDAVTITAAAGQYSAHVTIGKLYSRGDTNLLPVHQWDVGTSGTQGDWTQNGTASENKIVIGGTADTDVSPGQVHPLGPSGTSEPLWYCRAAGASPASSDGGWTQAAAVGGIPVNLKKAYRYSVWVRFDSGDTYGHGSIYLGPRLNSAGSPASNILNLNGTTNTNPYFVSQRKNTLCDATNGLQPDTWYLMVGVVHGQDYASASSSGVAGIYDTSGRLLFSGTEFKWNPTGMASGSHRALQYYCEVPAQTWFARPRMEEINGNEPTIAELVSASGRLIPTPQISANAVTKQVMATLGSDVNFGYYGSPPQYALAASIDTTREPGESYSSVIRFQLTAIVSKLNTVDEDNRFQIVLDLIDDDLETPVTEPSSPNLGYYAVFPEVNQPSILNRWYNHSSAGSSIPIYTYVIEKIISDPNVIGKALRFEILVRCIESSGTVNSLRAGTVLTVQEIKR